MKSSWPAWKWAFGLLLPAWFLYFSRDVLNVHFSPDDMMNIDNFYWSPGPWRVLVSQFLLWRGYYRPMGGVFYLPILSAWGLNPAPYHAAQSMILLACVWLVYRLARLLGASRLAGGLAALATCYHAGLANLYYNTAFIYDVLCGFFFLAALVYYAGIRSRGLALTVGQLAAFLALMVCALNSKEMALTLPAVVLAYEWIYHPATVRNGGRPAAWLRGPALAGLLAGVLTLADLYGKVFGHDALTGMEGYRPVFTWQRVIAYQKTFLGDAAFWHPGGTGLALFWISITYLAWRPGAKAVLRYCWAMLLLTPVPIEFLPGKSQGCLFIPMLALAMFAAVIVGDLAEGLAGVLEREPLFRRLGRQTLTAALVIAAIFYWGRENERRRDLLVEPVMRSLGAQTAQVLAQFRALNPHVRPHSHVLFLNDPFSEWDMLFIADLWFRDRSLDIRIQRLTPVSPEDAAKADCVFDYRDGELTRVH